MNRIGSNHLGGTASQAKPKLLWVLVPVSDPLSRTMFFSSKFRLLGPRACIGKKFILTEATMLLTLLMRDWRIEPLLAKGETLEQWKTKVFDVTLLILLGIKNVPIRLVRRK